MAGIEKDGRGIVSLPASDLKKLDSAIYESDLESSFHHELDGIHGGLGFPTEHERQTLRRIPDTLPCNAYRESTIYSLSQPF